MNNSKNTDTKNKNNNFNDNPDKHLHLTNLYVASFLLAKGIPVIDLEWLNETQASFIFQESAETLSLLKSFSFAPKNDQILLLDARDLLSAIRLLKEKLYLEKR